MTDAEFESRVCPLRGGYPKPLDESAIKYKVCFILTSNQTYIGTQFENGNSVLLTRLSPQIFITYILYHKFFKKSNKDF